MPLVSPVGRKRPRAILAMALLYIALAAGGATMVYPFLFMMSTGLKGPTDQNDNRLVPAFLGSEYELRRKFVDDKYGGKIDLASPFYGTSVATVLFSPTETAERVRVTRISRADANRFEKFLLSLPPHEWEAGFRLAPGRVTSKLSARYQDWLREKYGSLAAINRVYLEQNVSFQTAQPPAEKWTTLKWNPPHELKWRDWLEFKATLPAEFRIPISVLGQWQGFLRAKYSNQISRAPREITRGAYDFSVVGPAPGTSDWKSFWDFKLPKRYRNSSPDAKWKALTGSESLPVAAYDADFVSTHTGELRRDFSSRNYRFVLDYVLFHGRAVWNTVLFCLLAVLTHLIVNPLAAYALSRFALPATGKILLFLLATMAFPAEVTMIPAFLLLRDLGLLNTFAALVLPTAASGYSIYLLKGFFDSLPKDLYESADIEGAGDGVKFFRITIPLSKPVLAVIALTSFMAAYGAFMYAFLVAQDERMWTLTVWIYQLQARAPKATMLAALTLAALPTLLVFLLAQRVILRGIILPGEK